MTLRSHLTRRGSRYYFRQRVPTDLVERLGVKEIRKSLQSSSPQEAARRVIAVSELHADFFERIRAMTDETEIEKHEDVLQQSVRVLLLQNRVLRIGKAEVDENFDAYRKTYALVAKDEKNRAVSPKLAPAVSAFLETFIVEKGGQWDESAHRHNINYIKLFLKIVGDKPLNAYTRQDVLKYVRTLECIHKNYGKSSKDAGLDVDEVLRFSEDKETMNITTLTKHFRCVKSLFTAANHHLDSEVNVEKLFGGIRFRDNVPKAKERKPWTVDDLNRLFATPIWKGTKAQKPSLRYQKGRRIIRDAYWWLPVIAIFTGMRLEEIAQLQCGDLKQTKDGIAYIEVAEGEGKRLKTDSSTRDVPVHPTLADLGFTALFQGGNAEDRIFPKLTGGGPQGKFGYQYSQDFTVYRRQTGLYEDLRDFHSFRHTFATHLRRAIKDILMVGEIVGHETQQIETQTYTHPTVADRYAAICKLDYVADGLEIGHLFPRTAE
jgi:integrase